MNEIATVDYSPTTKRVMKVTASVAVSSDGYMDDCTPQRLVLSCPEDWQKVYRLRAECDAILVGAGTVRADNPSLVIRNETLRSERIACGKPADITKVVISGSGNLDSNLRFFTEAPEAKKIVICKPEAGATLQQRLGTAAEVVALPIISAHTIVYALSQHGIESLLIEGGAKLLKLFMDEEMIDVLRLAISPIEVNDSRAPRMPYFEQLPLAYLCAQRRTTTIGDMTVHEYRMHDNATTRSPQDRTNLLRAIEISRKSEPCLTSYRVGCVIATLDGKLYEGYTHETDPHNHAEEEAITKTQQGGSDLRGGTIYTSMEPCSKRSSKPVSCSELIIRYGLARVIYAYAEPNCFVQCDATPRLRQAGVEVIPVTEYEHLVKEINVHIVNIQE